MNWAIAPLAELLRAEVHGFGTDAVVTGFVTDSGEAKLGDMFIAIEGARVDGHDFVGQAMVKGAVGALVTRHVEAPHLLVGDVVQALARFASAQRDRFTGPVVGITGSAGKTTTKEFLAAALSPLGPVLKTVGNRNTEYTAPLVWAELRAEHRSVVIEMSMRGFGQIAHLAAFSRPNIGVITNIGYAHMEMVGSREGIARAKGELLQALEPGGTAVLWQGDLYLPTLRSLCAGRVLTFGYTDDADCRITRYRPTSWTSAEVEGTLGGSAWKAIIPAVGRHIALNAAAAVLAAWVAGVNPDDAARAIQNSVLPPMRMEVREINGATLLLDTYNASPPSMVAAIQTLKELPCSGRRLAVIGEMKELGEFTIEAHRQLGQALVDFGIDQVVFYGDATEYAWNAAISAGMQADKFTIAHSLEKVREFLQGVRPGDSVLVKGSRALELETALPAEKVRA